MRRFIFLYFLCLFFLTSTTASAQHATMQLANLPHYSSNEQRLSGQGAGSHTPKVSIEIDLSEQSLAVKVGNTLWHRWPISSGKAGYTTPKGRFAVQRMHRTYFSKTYDFVPMPHALFFHKGVAIHGTMDVGTLGRPASKGCVRLSPKHAEILYDLVYSFGTKRTKIEVRD